LDDCIDHRKVFEEKFIRNGTTDLYICKLCHMQKAIELYEDNS